MFKSHTTSVMQMLLHRVEHKMGMWSTLGTVILPGKYTC